MTRELARRIAFTIGALLLYRLGSFVPLPGLNPDALKQLFGIGMSDKGIHRVSILYLSLTPYVGAAIVVRVLSMVWGRLSLLERSGEAGRRKIDGYTLITTLLIAGFQAYDVAVGVKSAGDLVNDPDGWFVLSAVMALIGGVFFLIWLSELITRHGIGNGLALLLSLPFLVSLPQDATRIFDAVRQGVVSSNLVLAHIVFWVVAVAVIVAVESARRNIRVEFAERRAGKYLLPARSAILPIKINNAGYLIPITVASLVFFPFAVGPRFLGDGAPWLAAASWHLRFGDPAHLIIGAIVVFVVAVIYTAHVADAEHAAESLHKHGGTIPNVEPGEPTAVHLDRIISLMTVVGAVYLTVVSKAAEVFWACGKALPYAFSGGAALIVVCTILDVRTQVRHLSLNRPGAEQR